VTQHVMDDSSSEDTVVLAVPAAAGECADAAKVEDPASRSLAIASIPSPVRKRLNAAGFEKVVIAQ